LARRVGAIRTWLAGSSVQGIGTSKIRIPRACDSSSSSVSNNHWSSSTKGNSWAAASRLNAWNPRCAGDQPTNQKCFPGAQQPALALVGAIAR